MAYIRQASSTLDHLPLYAADVVYLREHEALFTRAVGYA
jgi:hypothetical protein